MKSLSVILGLCVLNFLALMSEGGQGGDDITGRISLAGCKKCTTKTQEYYRCYVTSNPVGCSSAGCDRWTYYYATCEKTPTGETDDCQMHSDVTALKGKTEKYQNTTGLTCTDNGPEKYTPPQDGDCQSPGFAEEVDTRCTMAAACGDLLIPDATTRYYSRLVCGT